MTERIQLTARLINELANARSAIAASYVSLWRSAERSLREAVDAGGDDEAGREPGAGGATEEPRSGDAG